MDDAQIRDELHTMLFAGSDTTANTLSWMFYYLTLNPEKMSRFLPLASSMALLPGDRNLMHWAKGMTVHKTPLCICQAWDGICSKCENGVLPCSSRCLQEVDALAAKGVPVSPSVLNEELPFLTACFKEALRLVPPATAVIRVCEEDIVLRGSR